MKKFYNLGAWPRERKKLVKLFESLLQLKRGFVSNKTSVRAPIIFTDRSKVVHVLMSWFFISMSMLSFTHCGTVGLAG